MRLVFISRISPKKNLVRLLEALAKVPVRTSLDIYGPKEDAHYWRECESLISSLPSHIEVTYSGALRPAEVPATFSRYDAFAFPTLGENFGHVIAESLASGCPVVCSDTTPWSAVLERGGGEVIPDLTADSWAEVLTRWCSASAEDRAVARAAAQRAFKDWRARQSAENILNVAIKDARAML